MLSSPASSIPNLKGLLSTSSSIKEEVKVEIHHTSRNLSDLDEHGWFYISVRTGLFLWVALLNLITISSTWARVIDAMDDEVQDCSDLWVLELHSANFLVCCLRQQLRGWDHIRF